MMSLVKADSWHYESEYRILAIPGTDWGHKLGGRFVYFAPEMSPAARSNSSTPGRVKIPHRCDGVMDDYASA